jgi:hypothetical protein
MITRSPNYSWKTHKPADIDFSWDGQGMSEKERARALFKQHEREQTSNMDFLRLAQSTEPCACCGQLRCCNPVGLSS